MRTTIIIVAGLVLWALALVTTKFLTQSNPTSFARATGLFICVWFAVAAANLWVGVHGAGYTFREELPVFLLIFIIPSGVAAFVKWRYF